MILMKETEVIKGLRKVPLEMLSIKKSILYQLSAINATWMHLNFKHDGITVLSARPLRKWLVFFNMLAVLALLSDCV